jgi:Na+/H+ antiporter NhaD/arsenite permease-like protein
MPEMLVAGALFLLTYAIIVTEKMHRTVAALAGGLLMIFAGIVTQEEAFGSIDLNVIFLLVGMMMIAHIMSETGVFQWMAVQAVRLGRGNPIYIMVIVALITALASSVLANVTVILLIAPVVILVASNLGVSPVPFLITSVMASNIGGALTLIGDPPNILIGSAAGIDFVGFLVNMGVPVILSLLAYMGVAVIQFRDELRVSPERQREAMSIEAKGLVKDPVLLTKSLVVLALVLVGFALQGIHHLLPATVAMSGATLLLIWTGKDPHYVLQHVEWDTLIFFVGLFITVEAVVKVGLIEAAAEGLLALTKGNLPITTVFILWISALASGIIDNIPYTATMIPLVQSLGRSMEITPLWWALALGADMGGNLTLVGASANVVAASLAQRSGHRITFMDFLKYGVATVFVSLLISTVWLFLRYLI